MLTKRVQCHKIEKNPKLFEQGWLPLGINVAFECNAHLTIAMNVNILDEKRKFSQYSYAKLIEIQEIDIFTIFFYEVA